MTTELSYNIYCDVCAKSATCPMSSSRSVFKCDAFMTWLHKQDKAAGERLTKKLTTMKKEITITAADVLREEYSRQEMHAIASTFLNRLYNTPEIKKETFIETKEAKPFCVIETDAAILLPFIGKKIPYGLYKEACNRGYMKWDEAEDWCKKHNACQFTIDELCVVRYFVKEIDEIFEKQGLAKFSKLLEGWVWSSSQFGYNYSWYCSSSSVGCHYKNYSYAVVPACDINDNSAN